MHFSREKSAVEIRPQPADAPSAHLRDASTQTAIDRQCSPMRCSTAPLRQDFARCIEPDTAKLQAKSQGKGDRGEVFAHKNLRPQLRMHPPLTCAMRRRRRRLIGSAVLCVARPPLSARISRAASSLTRQNCKRNRRGTLSLRVQPPLLYSFHVQSLNRR